MVPAAISQNATIDMSTFAANTTAGAAMTKINCKYPSMNFPSLGGAIVANYAIGDDDDHINPTQYMFGAYSMFDQDAAPQGNGKYTAGKVGGRYYTFQLISSLFGGCAEKYSPKPMSAIMVR